MLCPTNAPMAPPIGPPSIVPTVFSINVAMI
jgi:hypothetical protein